MTNQASNRTQEIQSLHRKHVLTPWSVQGGLTSKVIERAEGSHLVDNEGTKLLDLASGLVAVNIGHGNADIVSAMKEQAEKLCYAAPGFFHEERAELGAELSRLSPWDEGARVFFTTGGAESNDDVVRIARALTGRSKVMTAYRSFHGSSGGALQLTGEDRRWLGEGASSTGIVRFFAPFLYRTPFFSTNEHEECERALDHVARLLQYEDPKRVAAILIEPIVGSNGVVVYPEGYLQGLRELTSKHGILLIFDEVMTGFGRTGDVFAAQRLGVTPDIITFAKGITSAYVPLGGVLIRESLARHFDTHLLPCGHTYSGHPFAVSVGLATLKAYEKNNLFTRGLEIEQWLSQGLEALKSKHEIVGDIRGKGSFFAIEFVKDKKSKEPLVAWQGEGGLGVMKNFYGELRNRGVYSFGRFNLTMVSPPLVVEKSEIDFAMQALDESIGAFAKSL